MAYLQILGFLVLMAFAGCRGNNNSILAKAVENGDLTAVIKSINQGADANITVKGTTAIDYAVLYGDYEIAGVLLGAGADVTTTNTLFKGGLITTAVIRKRNSLVKYCLRKGADPDTTNTFGTSLLMIATRLSDTNTVKLLLDSGADVDKIDANGRTAIWEACANTNIAQILLDNGASVVKPDSLGMTVIDFADKSGFTNMVELLRNRGMGGIGVTH